MHPACPNKKQNHLQNSFLRRAQFWVRKTFSKPASLKRASLVSIHLSIYVSIYLSISIYRSIVVVVVVVVVGVVVAVAVAVVVEVRVVKLVKLVKLISVYFFDIFTSKKAQNLSFYTFDFEMCFAPQRRALFWHFFDIWTSKSGPRPSVFNTFDLEICFAPQRRALFRHLNFQKWSEAEVFYTFWLRNVLRATTACTFSTSQLPKVVRSWGVLYILTWKCASRHNGVQLFISHLASWLRTRRFSEPTFRPSGATNHWKNTVFRDFPTFRASASSFFWSFLFWLFSPLLFNCPYCRKFHF